MEFTICKSKTWVLLLYFHECSTAITKLLSQDPRQYHLQGSEHLLTRKLKICILTAQVSSTRQEQLKLHSLNKSAHFSQWLDFSGSSQYADLADHTNCMVAH